VPPRSRLVILHAQVGQEDVGGLNARDQPTGLGDARGRLQLVARQHPRSEKRLIRETR